MKDVHISVSEVIELTILVADHLAKLKKDKNQDTYTTTELNTYQHILEKLRNVAQLTGEPLHNISYQFKGE